MLFSGKHPRVWDKKVPATGGQALGYRLLLDTAIELSRGLSGGAASPGRA